MAKNTTAMETMHTSTGIKQTPPLQVTEQGEKERRFSFSLTSSSTLIGMRTKRKKTKTVGHESHWQKEYKERKRWNWLDLSATPRRPLWALESEEAHLARRPTRRKADGSPDTSTGALERPAPDHHLHKYPAAEQKGLVLGPCPSTNGARRPPGEFCVFEYLSQTAAVDLHPACAARTMHVRGPLLVNNLKAAGVNKPAPRISP
ncbi:hypothetical protein PtA15_8A200 [Puccinia triticina]|uniref:Uncharacterized protein n=1 Tax=Puccinia triticina TaxID=208348 RepID=A0ABY7CT42_9BASI|nr:uncharacterized protein PtA15_8A200 [Puccinia triticina]WAQ87296.1 hypothetical protein PtA15_8A200 [Puccinia triticina]